MKYVNRSSWPLMTQLTVLPTHTVSFLISFHCLSGGFRKLNNLSRVMADSWHACGGPSLGVLGCGLRGHTVMMPPKAIIRCSRIFKVIFHVFFNNFCLIYQIHHLNK